MKNWSTKEKIIGFIAIIAFIIVTIVAFIYLNNRIQKTREKANEIQEQSEYVKQKTKETTDKMVEEIRNSNN